MRYFYRNGEVVAYTNNQIDDGLSDGLIELSESDVLKHSTPKPSDFHTEWNGTEWIDSRTEEEKLAYKRSQYPKLTRYQFMRGMLENGYKPSDIETQIMLIEDEYTRELTMLGFKDAGYFDRNDQGIAVMRDVLEKKDSEIDEFWEFASNL